MTAPAPEGATPLQSALWEMGRLMEVFGENSVAAMEYRAKRLIEQDQRFRSMTSDSADGFYTSIDKLRELITREISSGSPLFAELHTLALDLLFARERAAAQAATEIADLRQRVRDQDAEIERRDATLTSEAP